VSEAKVAEVLTDGEWHRLHPATPLLKGGIALLAILGVVIVNLRDVWIEVLIGGPGRNGDPFVWLVEGGYLGFALLAIAGGLILFILGFYLSWRMHSFRITEEVVEVRSGILFRTNRKGRLDRIQGINIVRPFFARLFGAAKLEVNVAGQDANVQLAYLSSQNADVLRRAILSLASGTRVSVEQSPQQVAASGGIIEKRVGELLAPELDPNEAPPESVVTMHLGRLIGSIVLSGFTVFLLLLIAAAIVTFSITGELVFVFGFIAPVIGMGSYYISKFTKSLRYSIAGTPDGVRVGFGLLSTSNETLPPGRIHSVQVSQPILWRPMGWWEIKVNRASKSSAQGAAGQANTTILPVGDLADVKKVLELVLPALVDEESIAMLERGITSKGGDDGFTNSPRRAAVLRSLPTQFSCAAARSGDGSSSCPRRASRASPFTAARCYAECVSPRCSSTRSQDRSRLGLARSTTTMPCVSSARWRMPRSRPARGTRVTAGAAPHRA
jgi:putative membrane protein